MHDDELKTSERLSSQLRVQPNSLRPVIARAPFRLHPLDSKKLKLDSELLLPLIQ
jgi:hypothetical protein